HQSDRAQQPGRRVSHQAGAAVEGSVPIGLACGGLARSARQLALAECQSEHAKGLVRSIADPRKPPRFRFCKMVTVAFAGAATVNRSCIGLSRRTSTCCAAVARVVVTPLAASVATSATASAAIPANPRLAIVLLAVALMRLITDWCPASTAEFG